MPIWGSSKHHWPGGGTNLVVDAPEGRVLRVKILAVNRTVDSVFFMIKNVLKLNVY